MNEAVVTLPLSSGFTIEVRPLPPYHLDPIMDFIPLLDLPKRKVKLVSGDEIEMEYQVPEEPPSPDDEIEFELYMKYKYVQERNVTIQQRRNTVRRDFLLANCVTIIDGPYDMYNEEWVNRVEAAMPGFAVPEHLGQRKLLFIKTAVICTQQEAEKVQAIAFCQEATMQGILAALQTFQSQVVGQEHSGGHKRKKKSR